MKNEVFCLTCCKIWNSRGRCDGLRCYLIFFEIKVSHKFIRTKAVIDNKLDVDDCDLEAGGK